MKYSPSLDGLRAVCALLVFVFHATTLAPGGFLGVDVFFVISGYLITTNLLSDIERYGEIRFRRFYVRRLRRLFPALLAMLVVSYALWPAAVEFGSPARATLLYYANWKTVVDGMKSMGYLGHAWSLSIEEQFYVMWPLALSALFAVARTRRRVAVCTVAIVAALAIVRALGAAAHSPWAAFASTLARIDEILVGAVFALWQASSRPDDGASARVRRVLAFVSMLFLGALVFTVHVDHAAWLYFGGFSGVAIGAAIVVREIVSNDATILGRGLRWRPLVEIGKRSYGVYLFHYPIVRALEGVHIVGGGVTNFVTKFVLKLGLTLAVAWLSYRFIEEPLLGTPARVRREPLQEGASVP